MLENDLTADQQVQLYELMKETTKPAPQFSNITDSEKFVTGKKSWNFKKNLKISEM